MLLVATSSLIGCRPSNDVPQNQEQQTAPEDNGSSGGGDVAAIGGGPEAPADAALVDSNSPFSHPIDQIPAGKRFREATRALDIGEFETAEKIRTELLQGDPQYHPLATAIEAIMLAKRGQLPQAMKLAEDLSELQVMQADAYVVAGEVFQIEHRLADATAALENALVQNPEHVRAHLWLGTIYYDTGAMRLATEHLRRAAELEPREINALLLSGKIHQDYEQYDDATADYRLVLKRIDDQAQRLPVEVRLAECLVETRRGEEAAQVLKGAPEVPAVLACRASIAEAAGDFEQAAELAQRALKANPGNLAAGMVLGRVRLTELDWMQAIQTLEPLVETNPYDHEPRMLLGRALTGAGEKERGEAEIRKATELKEAFLKFADLHQEAIRLPNDASLRVQLGRLAETLGKQELARSWYRAALGLVPDDAEAKEGLDRLKL